MKRGRGQLGQEALSESMTALELAISDWVDRGRPGLLKRWLEAELDEEGVPRRLPVGDWLQCLAELARARRTRAQEWPELWDALADGFLLQALRFCRPDGSAILGVRDGGAATSAGLEYWADCLKEPGIKRVLGTWFPQIKSRRTSLPEPAWSHAGQPLTMLRPDWTKAGDLIAIDHREQGTTTRLELVGQGRSWLGPTWTGSSDSASTSAAQPTRWVSDGSVDLSEWCFRVGSARYTRTALLLRGRRLALLAEQVDSGDSPTEMRLAVPLGVEAIRSPANRGLVLTAGPRRPTFQLLPLGLAESPTVAEAGSLTCQRNEVRLVQHSAAKRQWMPLLLSWDSARTRKQVAWRKLTITEDWKVCPDESAVAYRVAWGRDDSLVIYRSLGRPAPRAFLGHRTEARFLVGMFGKDGELDPILSVEE